MNAPVAHTAIVPGITHDVAAAFIHAWRGRCLDLLARGEALIVSEIERRGKSVPQLTGQRNQMLADLLAEEGASAARAAKALSAFREHERLRRFLCHGVTHIASDADANWLAVLTMPAGERLSTDTCLALNEASVKAVSRSLQSAKDRLRNALAAP